MPGRVRLVGASTPALVVGRRALGAHDDVDRAVAELRRRARARAAARRRARDPGMSRTVSRISPLQRATKMSAEPRTPPTAITMIIVSESCGPGPGAVHGDVALLDADGAQVAHDGAARALERRLQHLHGAQHAVVERARTEAAVPVGMARSTTRPRGTVRRRPRSRIPSDATPVYDENTPEMLWRRWRRTRQRRRPRQMSRGGAP